MRKALQRLSDAVTNLGRGRTESGRNFFEGSPTQDPGVYEAWLELNKAQVEAARALAARSTDGWRTIDSAPKGRDHPYKKSPDAEPATFVVVWNGFHQGIAYCEIDYGDTEQWWDEGGDPVEPPPFKWHPLLPNPLPEPPSSEVK